MKQTPKVKNKYTIERRALDFGAETGQVVGHHFSSGIVTGDFGCTIERLYEAFNAKLAAYIPASDSGQDPQ
jgi:hypothetical protein